MAYVSGYENDVFISYAHKDNDPIIKIGWVDFFEELLRKRLRAQQSEEINIFRDPQLRQYGEFDEQLAVRLTQSAVFICVLSPNYVGSTWCLREMEQFCQRAGTGRVIKVVKLPFDEQDIKPEKKSLLERLQNVLDCRLYKKDERSGSTTELQPEVFPDDFQVYFRQVDAIARNLVELLKKLCGAPPHSAPSSVTSSVAQGAGQAVEASAPPQIAVYLAEPAKGLEAEYNSIKSELLQFNYRVLPDQPLPLDAEELAHTARRHLREAKLFVHLIGAKYGVRPDGDDRSIPHIQYDLAAELDEQRQVVWLPADLTPENKNQEEFVARIKNHSPNYWQTKLEDLKTAIRKKLQPVSPSGWDEDENADPINVCLFCDEQDIDSVKPLYNHLKLKELFKVKLPLKEAQSLRDHKQLLQSSDAVLLYYGIADEEWFDQIWQLIEKYTSVGRTKPILAKAIYTGQPPTSEKDLLDSDDPLVLKNYGQFTASAIAPFIARIRAAKGGAK